MIQAATIRISPITGTRPCFPSFCKDIMYFEPFSDNALIPRSSLFFTSSFQILGHLWRGSMLGSAFGQGLTMNPPTLMRR